MLHASARGGSCNQGCGANGTCFIPASFEEPSGGPASALLDAGGGADSAVMGEGTSGLWAPTVRTVEGKGDLVSA